VRPEGLGKLKELIHLIGYRTRDLPACSIMPQPHKQNRSSRSGPYEGHVLGQRTDRQTDCVPGNNFPYFSELENEPIVVAKC
jgi:hypothetical protein